MPSIVLRFGDLHDAEVIHRMICELATYEKEPLAVETTVEQLREQLADPRPPFECVLAEDQGQVLGFALFFHSYSTWRGRQGLYLEDLFVRPEHRGRGVGRALLCALAKIAVSRNCARMEWAVLNWNASAIGFYRTLGALPLDGWTVYRLTNEALDRAAGLAQEISAIPDEIGRR